MDEKQRLLEDLNDKERELDHIEDQIRLGHANEDEEWNYMNELQNEIMNIIHCLEDFDD